MGFIPERLLMMMINLNFPDRRVRGSSSTHSVPWLARGMVAVIRLECLVNRGYYAACKLYRKP